MVLRGSEDLFGVILFASLLTQVPVNIYLIRNMIFRNPPTLILIFIRIVLCFQTLAGCFTISLLAWENQVYHKPKKWIPNLQTMINGHYWIWYKIKYDDLYNRLVSGVKISITMGPFGLLECPPSGTGFYRFFHSMSRFCNVFFSASSFVGIYWLSFDGF